jgi:DNA-binding response OmpR family regulator
MQGSRPNRTILVADANRKQCQDLCLLLEREHYKTLPLHSLADLEATIREGPHLTIILDLDTLRVDNRMIRDLRKQDRRVRIVGLSSRPFHPELEEALTSHIYACLAKPIDPDELFYVIRSVHDNDPELKIP